MVSVGNVVHWFLGLFPLGMSPYKATKRKQSHITPARASVESLSSIPPTFLDTVSFHKMLFRRTEQNPGTKAVITKSCCSWTPLCVTGFNRSCQNSFSACIWGYLGVKSPEFTFHL